MIGDQERDLRRAFRELRSPDLQHAPGLRAVLDRPRAERLPPIALFASVAVAAASIIALLVAWPRTPDVVPNTMSITEWRAPTDVLLRTPGAEIIKTVPTLRSAVFEGFGLPIQ